MIGDELKRAKRRAHTAVHLLDQLAELEHPERSAMQAARMELEVALRCVNEAIRNER